MRGFAIFQSNVPSELSHGEKVEEKWEWDDNICVGFFGETFIGLFGMWPDAFDHSYDAACFFLDGW